MDLRCSEHSAAEQDHDAPEGLLGTVPSMAILGTGCVSTSALDVAVNKR